MMHGFASVAGLPDVCSSGQRALAKIWSSHWVGLADPKATRDRPTTGRFLKMEVGPRDHDIADLVPDPPEGLLPFREAVRLAIKRVQDADVATRWSSASVAGARATRCPRTLVVRRHAMHRRCANRSWTRHHPGVGWVEGIGGEHSGTAPTDVADPAGHGPGGR